MKILYVTTISNTVNAFLIPHIKVLIEQGHQVDVAFNIVQEVNKELIELGCKIYNIEFQRSPLDKRNYFAYKKLRELIKDEDYEIVHTHTPIASACVRLVCKGIKDLKVIYTAHGFHFYKGAPLINWLIYYPIERLLAKYTDVLITINQEDYIRAQKSFKAKRIEYIPGVGLDFTKYQSRMINILEKREELDISKDAFTVLSVGELNKNKNHETIIKAIAKINNPNISLVICGKGVLENHLRNLIQELGLENQVRLLGFRKDIREICKSVDAFIFPSFREGLSVALMEAMASGLPVVCSKIRGNTDLIEDGKGGYLVTPNDVQGFADALQKLSISNDLRREFSKSNLEGITKFSLENVIVELNNIYQKVIK